MSDCLVKSLGVVEGVIKSHVTFSSENLSKVDIASFVCRLTFGRLDLTKNAQNK